MNTTGKIVVIGAGFVGSTSAYAMLMDGVASEITLLDVNREKVEGEAMDLEHGMQFVPGTKISYGTEYRLVRDAEVIVIAAGAGQKPGQSRRDLVATNASIIKSIIGKIKQYNTDCILLVVTNPVDALTFLARQYSGFSRERVFGTGTMLDSARFRYYLGETVHVHPHSIHAYILGEHGDSEFPVWSSARVGGASLLELPQLTASIRKHIAQKTRKVVYEIIARKGATYYAVGLAVAKLVRAIINNTSEIFPVSCVLQKYHGVSNVALSVPVVVNRSGAHIAFQLPLSAAEQKQFRKCACIVRALTKGLA